MFPFLIAVHVSDTYALKIVTGGFYCGTILKWLQLVAILKIVKIVENLYYMLVNKIKTPDR